MAKKQENKESVWAIAGVVTTKNDEGKEKTEAYALACIEDSYEHAIGYAVTYWLDKSIHNEVMNVISVDATTQDTDDLKDMMERKGLIMPKKK